MLTFTHAGRIEDILYSLYFCRQLSRKYDFRSFNYHIQTNVVHNKTNLLMTQKDAEFLKPLFETQKWIQKFTYGPNKPEKAIDLNKFRNGAINCNSGDLRDVYYQFNSNDLPRHFDICNIRLKEPADQKYKDKIIFSLSQKFINSNLNFNLLEKYKQQLVFLGTQNEYESFCSKYFIIPNFELNVNSMLTAAKYMAGAKGFIGNQNQYFALAEGMKLFRILLPFEWKKDLNNRLIPGIKNIIPFGGWTAVASINEKMISSLENLINYVDIDDRKTKGVKND